MIFDAYEINFYLVDDLMFFTEFSVWSHSVIKPVTHIRGNNFNLKLNTVIFIFDAHRYLILRCFVQIDRYKSNWHYFILSIQWNSKAFIIIAINEDFYFKFAKLMKIPMTKSWIFFNISIDLYLSHIWKHKTTYLAFLI